ncbi:hypothetical protein [Paralysiella testudinis]|uniref:Uncharacterized protein n=1 Tax=Paralysiella testudinis TaxID=2809020 RepID=A0A892ZGB4_9NEIS|nr:hypothetical protein [Paralysiella testudinis]QRQ82525.1 hypothetical protein JQU52_03760 [Paralysiella testudinis]
MEKQYPCILVQKWSEQDWRVYLHITERVCTEVCRWPEEEKAREAARRTSVDLNTPVYTVL